MIKLIKLLSYIVAGGISGAIFPLIFFVGESSVNRSIPEWGLVLSIIFALAGAIGGYFSYQDIYGDTNAEHNDKSNT